MSMNKFEEEQKRWNNHQVGILRSYFESLRLPYGANVTPQHLGRKLREHIQEIETEGNTGILSAIDDSLNIDSTGNHVSAGSIVAVEGFKYDPERFELVTPYSDTEITFTPLQGKIFHPLILNPGRFVTTTRLIDLAWNYEPAELGVLKTHIFHIRKKLTNIQKSANLPQFNHIVNKSSVGYSFIPKVKKAR